MSVMIANSPPDSLQRKEYHQNLGKQMRQVNQVDMSMPTNDATDEEVISESDNQQSSLTNHF
jgi:hypothetical protein